MRQQADPPLRRKRLDDGIAPPRRCTSQWLTAARPYPAQHAIGSAVRSAPVNLRCKTSLPLRDRSQFDSTTNDRSRAFAAQRVTRHDRVRRALALVGTWQTPLKYWRRSLEIPVRTVRLIQRGSPWRFSYSTTVPMPMPRSISSVEPNTHTPGSFISTIPSARSATSSRKTFTAAMFGNGLPSNPAR